MRKRREAALCGHGGVGTVRAHKRYFEVVGNVLLDAAVVTVDTGLLNQRRDQVDALNLILDLKGDGQVEMRWARPPRPCFLSGGAERRRVANSRRGQLRRRQSLEKARGGQVVVHGIQLCQERVWLHKAADLGVVCHVEVGQRERFYRFGLAGAGRSRADQAKTTPCKKSYSPTLRRQLCTSLYARALERSAFWLSK